MKYYPMLFSGEMVRAILEGRKTMTRRPIKPQPEFYSCGVPGMEDVFYYQWKSKYGESENFEKECLPTVGDHFWVKETFCLLDHDHWWDYRKPRDYLYNETDRPRRNACAYRAETDAEGERIRIEYGYKWTPSIHMPRWASRLTLRITDVRVERVQDISEIDIRSEGIRGDVYGDDIGIAPKSDPRSARVYFMELWNSIYAKRGLGWEINPWVAAYTFEIA